MNINSITNQLSVSVAKPEPGSTIKLNFSAAEQQASVSHRQGTVESSPLLNIDTYNRQGYQSGYTVEDAATSLWKRDNLTFNLNDPDSFNRHLSLAKAHLRSGVSTLTPTEAELSAYIDQLRQTGLDVTVDWSGLEREFAAFQATTPDELADSLDYLASRYVAVLDKLERNYSGDGLTEQKALLESAYQTGTAGLIDGYTQLLQSNLGISDTDAQTVKDSFAAILEQKVNTYRGALAQVNQSVADTGADSVWLQNHDAYIAAQLRETVNDSSTQTVTALYTVQDLTIAGKVAQEYAAAIPGNRNEAVLALNLAMADMKTETMISQGLLSDSMAALLRSSRAQAHENVLNAADQWLANRESSRQSGEPEGTYAAIDRTLFQGIYNAVMNAYQQNGGNGADAIRAGVSYGQTVTAQASKANPNVMRWGLSMENYWKDFYTTPEARETTALDQQIDKLLEQAGQSNSRGNSTYQNYVNSWHSFINSVFGGIEIWA